jgi:hypothetical protein
MTYGEQAVPVGSFELADWHEFLHYLYLPVFIPGQGGALPKRLEFMQWVVDAALRDAYIVKGRALAGLLHDHYVYVTARRGFATPDNPLNRPGWHCDGFGTDDLNYVWWDVWGTRFADHEFTDISDDHLVSMEQFEEQVDSERVVTLPGRVLYRLTPFVVHTTPEIPPPGGMRSFLKVSISRHRYNLLGNSHNFLLDYDWPMHARDVARNDPAHYMADFYDDGGT